MVATAATPGEDANLSAEQQQVLVRAFATWPGLKVTNHGYEWSARDRDDTAQEIVVTVQALSRSLQSLAPRRVSSKNKRFGRFGFGRRGTPGRASTEDEPVGD